jgi:shikimate kinase
VATVALLGLSTAGKSTVLRHFTDIMGDSVDTRDSDAIMSQEFGGHIYLLFSALVEGRDREKALAHIERSENEILASLQPQAKPRLIAFGPAVPSRSEWGSFIERVNPVVFQLELSVDEVLIGLAERRARHLRAGLEPLPGFGSWDEDVTTEYDSDSERWVPIVNDRTVHANISRHTRALADMYHAAAGAENTYSARRLMTDSAYQQDFYARVSAALLS